jgi:hypothetical protein
MHLLCHKGIFPMERAMGFSLSLLGSHLSIEADALRRDGRTWKLVVPIIYHIKKTCQEKT